MILILSFVLSNLPQSYADSAAPPLKITTCELLLRSGLQNLAAKDPPLFKLRRIRRLLNTEITNEPKSEEGSYKSFFYNGTLEDISKRVAKSARERIFTIEQTLLNQNPDDEAIAIEITGDKLLQGLSLLRARSGFIESTYADEIERQFPMLERLKQIGSYTMLPIMGGVALLAGGESGNLLITTVGLSSVTPTSFAYFYFDMARDSNFEPLTKFLAQLATPPYTNKVYFYGDSFEVPSDFHEMVMSGENRSNDALSRRQAVLQWGRPLPSDRFIRETLPTRWFPSQAATDGSKRFLYIDHFAYYDPITFEPTWLIVYRAYAKDPRAH